MNRLTKRWDDNCITIELNCDFLREMPKEDFEHFQAIIKKLAKYEDTGFEPEEIEKLHKSCALEVGQDVYVITQYSSFSSYEVIKCKINRKTVKRRNTFSVSGHYENGNCYNGTFVEKSIGRNVFIFKEEANKKCKELNVKR